MHSCTALSSASLQACHLRKGNKYFDMCGPKGYGFSAVLIGNGYLFWPFGHE